MKSLRNGLMVASAIALAAAAAPAVAQDVSREQTVIFDLDRTIADPTNFNWFTPGAYQRVQGAHQAMWEPLFILNYETGETEPWLGTGFEPNDALDSWTLTLRDGVEWSDGEPFNADDVMFTINMLLDDETATLNEAANMQQWVDSVEKIDDLTVQFNLSSPNPRFPLDYFSVRIFGSLLVMPEHVWAGQDPETFKFYDQEQGWPIGTGPYTFTNADTSRAVWDRNDNWWGAASGFMALPEPQRLIWQESGTEENRAQLLANNQLDAGQNVTLGAFEVIQAMNPSIIAWHDGLPFAWPDPCARQLEINTTVAPWDDPNMRQALNAIIDRNQIVNVAYEGTTVPSRTMFVEYGAMEPFIGAIEAQGMTLSPTADMDAARTLIEGAGYTLNGDDLYERDGEVLSADIYVNNASTEYTRTIDVIVEQLRRAGIDALARPVENATFWGQVLPLGDYALSYSWLSCGSVNEPWASMNRYTNHFIAPIGERAPGFNNTGRWDTEATANYTAIVDEIGTLPLGDPAIPGLVADAYQYLNDEMPFIPLVQASKLLPYNTTYWTGWPTAENNYIHPAHWWNHTHQIIHNLSSAGS